MYSEKTIYNYVDKGLFEARNLDMPRKVRFRPRKNKQDSIKVDKGCRLGRTYKDYVEYMKDYPDLPIVQIDSVIGEVGGKVLLTIHFVKAEFMLAFIRDRNTAASVEAIFERLYWELFPDSFMKLFPALLADNGSEFSDPTKIEFDKQGNQRTRVFYCDPSSPYQKGAAENNHSMIRRILPKGTSFNHLTQGDIDLMMQHINSYRRKNLGDFTPYEIFAHFYGKKQLEKLGAKLIPTNEVTLHPALLR
jgi:IS30 family transposase